MYFMATEVIYGNGSDTMYFIATEVTHAFYGNGSDTMYFIATEVIYTLYVNSVRTLCMATEMTPHRNVARGSLRLHVRIRLTHG